MTWRQRLGELKVMFFQGGQVGQVAHIGMTAWVLAKLYDRLWLAPIFFTVACGLALLYGVLYSKVFGIYRFEQIFSYRAIIEEVVKRLRQEQGGSFHA